MSGRPWVQLATKVYTDPKMLKLPRDVFGNFVMCLAMAGANDDGGRLGPVDEVAMMLHISEDEVARVVAEMGGRIRTDRAGCLWIRDWAQWQPPTTAADRARKAREAARMEAERQQAHGSGDAERLSQADANEDATLRQRDTNENGAYQNQELNKNQDSPLTPKGAGDQPPAQTFTDAVSAGIAASLGDVRVTARGGKLLLWVVDVVRMLDKWSGHDAAAAIGIWQAFVDSPEWKFKGADQTKWATALGDWYANRRPGAKAASSNGHDDRFWFKAGAGKWSLKDPQLVAASMGDGFNPHDPATWPQDMRLVYAGRIHVSDGREVFA